MSKQSGDEIFVVDGSLGDPSIKLGRRDTGFYVTRPGTYDANAPLRVATVVAGVLQGQADKFAAAPVDGVAATLTVTINPNINALDWVELGGQRYTFVAALSVGPAVPYEVLKAGTANGTSDSLIKAINGTVAPLEHSATVQNPYASAGARAGNDFTVTARVKGVAGNSIPAAKSGANITVAGTLSGGIDGTVGSVGQIATDGTNLYICLAAGGITDSGKWKKITIGVL